MRLPLRAARGFLVLGPALLGCQPSAEKVAVQYTVPPDSELEPDDAAIRRGIFAATGVTIGDGDSRLSIDELRRLEKAIYAFHEIGLVRDILEAIVIRPPGQCDSERPACAFPDDRVIEFCRIPLGPKGDCPDCPEYLKGPLEVIDTFAHELGHLIEAHHPQTRIAAEFADLHARSASRADFVSDYAMTDEHEDFASTFATLAVAYRDTCKLVEDEVAAGSLLGEKFLLLMEYLAAEEKGRIVLPVSRDGLWPDMMVDANVDGFEVCGYEVERDGSGRIAGFRWPQWFLHHRVREDLVEGLAGWLRSRQRTTGLFELDGDEARATDQALAALAFRCLQGRSPKGSGSEPVLVAEFFRREYGRQVNAYGGFIGFYDRYSASTGQPIVEGGRPLGPNALLLAAVGEQPWGPSEMGMCDWILSLQTPSGAIAGGYDALGQKLDACRTEDNIAALYGLERLCRTWGVGADPYRPSTVKVEDWLLDAAWDSQRFIAGKDDTRHVAGAYAMGFLFYHVASEGPPVAGLPESAVRIFGTTIGGISGLDAGGPGIYPDLDGVDFASTAQAALALRLAGRDEEGLALLAEIEKAVRVEGDVATLPEATNACTLPFGDGPADPRRPAIAPACWYILAAVRYDVLRQSWEE